MVTTTVAANAHLRLMFGWPSSTPVGDVRPFDPSRFTDDQARTEFLRNLTQDGHVEAYLLRLRRATGSIFWLEVTARAEPAPHKSLRVEAVLRDVTERKKAAGPGARGLPAARAGRKNSRRLARRCQAWRTS
jgi:PAS domain S-box-containing protein